MINILSRVPSDITTLYETFIKPQTGCQRCSCSCDHSCSYRCYRSAGYPAERCNKKYSGSVRKENAGKKNGWRSVIQHSSESKYSRCYSCYLCFFSGCPCHLSFAAFMGRGNGNGIGSKILKGLSQQNWFSLSNPVYTLGFVLYAVMIVFFAYFYTSITFNPIEVADNMKKQGGFIPGIRPVKPTQDYLEKILNYIIFIGAIGLLIVCTIPIVFNGAFGASVSFGGTSIIIIVGVVLETLKQIESQMLVRNYRGFLSE